MKSGAGRYALVGMIALSGCISPFEVVVHEDVDRTVRGSGLAAVESRGVAGIFGVSVSGVGLVVIDRTGRESLTIEADHNILPLLRSEVRGGILHLGVRHGHSISPRVPIEYRLTVREMDEIEVSGAAEVDAAGIDTGLLVVNVSGAGKVIVAGGARRQEVVLSGVGQYWADNLDSRMAVGDLSGASYMLVRARDLLDVHVSGAALVEYMGRPVIRAAVSGSGEVRPY